MTSPAASRCPNPEHGPVPEGGACLDCYRALGREHTALGDRYMRLLHEQRQHDEDTRAAAARAEHGRQRAFAHLILPQLLAEALPSITQLAQRAAVVDPAWGRSEHARCQLEQLQRLAGPVSRAYFQALDKAPGLLYADPARTEVEQLRGLIVATGRAWHDEYGSERPCHCDGCTLIRSMDLLEAVQPEGVPGEAEVPGHREEDWVRAAQRVLAPGA